MTVRIAVLTVSDRASRGEYEDLGGPAVKAWLERVMSSPAEIVVHVIPDGLESVRDTLIRLCDEDRVDMVLTTGGTGPSPRDLTPEAMKAVMEKELPGFGELMRKVSLEQVPTAILSRQTAGTRGKTLIVVFPAIPFCLDLIGAGRIETHDQILKAFRPSK
jgi:molybdopterin adenylyltransferase